MVDIDPAAWDAKGKAGKKRDELTELDKTMVGLFNAKRLAIR